MPPTTALYSIADDDFDTSSAVSAPCHWIGLVPALVPLPTLAPMLSSLAEALAHVRALRAAVDRRDRLMLALRAGHVGSA